MAIKLLSGPDSGAEAKLIQLRLPGGIPLRMIAIVLRVYSFHLILAFLMIGVSAVVWTSGSNNLRLGMLPWTGVSLTHVLFWGGAIALVCLLLAITGWLRFLFPIWALVVLVMMVRGYLFSSYTFKGRTEFEWVLLLLFGALLAFFGSLTVFRSRRPRRA